MSRGRTTDATPRRRDDVGATLPELLLVIVVLGALAAATVVAVGRLRSDAISAVCGADRAAIERAAALWMEQSDTAPTAADLVDAGLLRTTSRDFELVDGERVVPVPGGRCAERSSTAAAAAGDDSGRAVRGDRGESTSIDDTIDDPIDDTIEVSLVWTGNADLDVWVQTPDGAVVGWTEAGPGVGRLDVDVVPPRPDAVGPHVERIAWPRRSAPGGDYVAWADFRTAGWGDQPAATFVLTVRRSGELLATLDGPIGPPGTRSAELSAAIS